MIVLMPFDITWFSYIATSGNIFSPLYSWFVFHVDKEGEIDKIYMKSLWDNFLYMKNMKSSIVSYKQSLQNHWGVNYMQIDIFFFIVAPNLQVVVIIKKGENVNHENFDDVKNIKPWIMVVIIKKGGECKSCWFWWCQKEFTWQRGKCESCISWWCRKRNHLIVIIKKGENVNLWWFWWCLRRIKQGRFKG